MEKIMTEKNRVTQGNNTQTVGNPYDALFKEVITVLFNELQIPIETEHEVSRKPRTIDAVITCTPSDIDKAKRGSPFDFLKKNNIIGFKSLSDPLTIKEYHKIVARAHFYIAENEFSSSESIICAVCSSEPRKLLHKSQETVEFTMIEPWHYLSNEKLPFHVIIIRKLPIEIKNYPLLVFAPIKKFEEFVKHAIDNNNLRYLEYAYILHPYETKEVLMMRGKIPIPEENVKFIVNDLTPERILRYIDIEDRLRGIDVEDILRQFDVEDRLRGIDVEDRLRGLSRDDLIKLQKFLNDKISKS